VALVEAEMKRSSKSPFGLRQLLEHLEPRLLLAAAPTLPTINLAATKATATELNGNTTGAGTFKLTRSGSTLAPLTVSYAIDASSTALSGIDFNILTGTATFQAGTANAFITINPVDTNLADGPKKLTLDLITTGTGPAYKLGSKKATITILDGDDSLRRRPMVRYSCGMSRWANRFTRLMVLTAPCAR